METSGLEVRGLGQGDARRRLRLFLSKRQLLRLNTKRYKSAEIDKTSSSPDSATKLRERQRQPAPDMGDGVLLLNSTPR